METITPNIYIIQDTNVNTTANSHSHSSPFSAPRLLLLSIEPFQLESTSNTDNDHCMDSMQGERKQVRHRLAQLRLHNFGHETHRQEAWPCSIVYVVCTY